MPTGPAARVTDPVVHPLPPILGPGPGSPNVLIGFMPAWRGMPLAAVAALMTAKISSDATIAAATGPALPAAQTAGMTAMTAAITSAAGGADIHACVTPVPHGPGVVITPSATVLINYLGAARAGDTILEAIGPPNSIAMGCPTVIIGG